MYVCINFPKFNLVTNTVTRNILHLQFIRHFQSICSQLRYICRMHCCDRRITFSQWRPTTTVHESESGRKLVTWHYGIPQMTVTRYGIAISRYMHAHITSLIPPISSYASRSAEQCAYQTNDELSENAFHASYSRMCMSYGFSFV